MVSAIGKQGWATAPSQGCWLEEGARGRGPKGVGCPGATLSGAGADLVPGSFSRFSCLWYRWHVWFLRVSADSGVTDAGKTVYCTELHRHCPPQSERAVHRGLLGKPEAVHRLQSLQTGPLERCLTASASPSTVLPCGPHPPLSRAGQADPARFQELEGRVSVLGETKEKPSSQMAT